MLLTDRLYENVKDIWEEYYTHPFIMGMKDGTLPKEKFRFYLIQDYLYLLDYAKVFALGVVKSNEEYLMREFALQVNYILNGEMTIHNEYVRRLGINPEEFDTAKRRFATIGYTNYMLAVAHQESALEILVAILACSWSYKLIGENISGVSGAIDHPFYGAWIQGYSDDAYRQSNQTILDLVNRAGANVTPEQESHLIEIIRTCSRFEYHFWDMGWNMT